MPAKPSQKQNEARIEKLQQMLLDPDFQDLCQKVLTKEFPRYSHELKLDKDGVNMLLLARDSAERMLECLYSEAASTRPRNLITHKRLIRTP